MALNGDPVGDVLLGLSVVAAIVVPSIAGIITWARWINGRLSRTMTREEHERICTQNQNRVIERLDGIEQQIVANAGDSREVIEKIYARLGNLDTIVARLDERWRLQQNRPPTGTA